MAIRTFYIRAGGSDAADGLSDANAWATWDKLRNFVNNAANTAPGDEFLLRGGDTFTVDAGDYLGPAENGTEANPFVVGAYGTGKPIISTPTALVGGLIWVNGRQYWTFKDLILQGAGRHLTAVSSSGIQNFGASHFCRFERVEIRAFNNVGLHVQGDNVTVDGLIISDVGTHGIVSDDPGDNIVVKNCKISGWGGNSFYESGGRHGIYLESKNGVCFNNEFFSPTGTVSGQAISVRKHGQRVYSNLIHDMPYAMAFFNYDSESVSVLNPGWSYIYGNICWNISGYGFYMPGDPPAVRVGGPGAYKNTVDMALYGNLFNFTDSGGFVVAHDAAQPNIDASTKFIGNVIMGTPDKYTLFAPPTRAGKSFVAKHNCYFGATQANPFQYGGTTYASLAAYKTGSGQEFGSLNQDPLLGAAPTFLKLGGSPLKDAGVDPDLGAEFVLVQG